jgi:hypothetical protein
MTRCTWKSDNLVNGYKNYMLSIKSSDSKLVGKDLTSVKFVSKISSLLINNKDNLFYSLKISQQNSNLPLIINVDSMNNEISQLDSETGLAYYAVKIYEYQLITEVDLCVISDEKFIKDNIVLYAKIIRQDEFNNDGFNEKLFNENYEEYEIKSRNNPKNYLHINMPKDEKDDDKIIFLVVKCNSMRQLDAYLNHYVKIMVSFFKPSANTSLKVNNYRLFNLYLESPNFFIPLIKNKYSILVIHCLSGKGKISIEDEKNELKNEIMADSMDNKEYKIVLNLRGNYDAENKFASVKIKNMNENVNDKAFLFYAYFYYKNLENNLEVIEQDKINAIYYPLINMQNHQSLAYYFNLNEIKDINDLLIEVTFNNEYINNNVNLNALGALINDEFIFQNTINEQYFIQSPLNSKSFYNSYSNKLYFLFNINEINKFKKYFSYCFISFTSNIINFEKIYDQTMNNLFIEIAIIPYNENKLRNSKEIVNKYHNINNDQSNKNNDENQNKSSFPTGIIIFLIIVFILFVLYLMLRIYRKRSIAKMNDYFRNDFPISN